MSGSDTADRTVAAAGVSRGRFLQQAGIGAAGLAIGGALSQTAFPEAAQAAETEAPDALNLYYFDIGSFFKHKEYLLQVLQQFTAQTGVKVNYLPEIGNTPQKLTTYLASGYSGFDVIWIDDLMTATFANAGFLEPLEGVIPHDRVAHVPPALVDVGTYNGHLYRIPAHMDVVAFVYRKDLFDQQGLTAPRTWQELIKVGQQLTKGGRYGLGIAAKNGLTVLYNELCYYMQQAGASPLHMTTPGARTALKFMYDLINTYKITPPDTVVEDYGTLYTALQDGRIAMWPIWHPQKLNANPKFKMAIALPPRGPVNNTTLLAAWGYAIPKFAKRKDLSAKLIQFLTQAQSEVTISGIGSTPANSIALANPTVAQFIPEAAYLPAYAKAGIFRTRPKVKDVQRVSDALEAPVNQYFNKQISLDSAISQAQQGIDRVMGNG